MDTATILSTMAAAATFLKKPIEDVTGKAISDSYEALKSLVKAKSDGSEEVSDAIAKLENKPDSKARFDLLSEEITDYKIHKDPAIIHAVAKLLEVLPKSAGSSFNVSIQQNGRGNRAQVAAGDIINTERHTKVVKFTPDESHISGEQAKRIRQLIDKLAKTLTGEDGKPNFRDAYGRLYNKFNIGTYRELKSESFDDAVSYLQQQAAINRPKLRRINPQAYRNNLYSPIWAKMKELSWDKPQVYAFASQKLELKKPISSLTQLGPNQLKSLYEYISRQ